MSDLVDVTVWVLIPLLYWAGCKIQSWRATKNARPTQYYCPSVEDRVSLKGREIVWKDGKSAYGMKCNVCDSVHVYDLGVAPAPIYKGDRIKLKVTSEGLVQAE